MEVGRGGRGLTVGGMYLQLVVVYSILYVRAVVCPRLVSRVGWWVGETVCSALWFTMAEYVCLSVCLFVCLSVS